MRQFLDVAEAYPDAIVFFRCGDFYEMFFESALLAARLLDLTLTSRDKGRDDAVPMCGVPHHAARGYIAKLTELGHKVVLCEQVEDPRLAKGLVKREVVRIVTPGIVLDDEILDPKLPRYVVALVPAPRDAATPVEPPPDTATGGKRASSRPAPAARAGFPRGTMEGPRSAVLSPGELCGLAYLDATTGELAATELPLAVV